MELNKNDVKMTKGLAIIFMVLLHLFCMKDNLPYSPWIYIGDTPLIYYIALFGDCCVCIYCFCSGYAHWIINENRDHPYKSILRRLPSFVVQYWIIWLMAVLTGLITRNEDIPGSAKVAIKSFLFVNNSYNGAWWFVFTYILLCILSPILIKMVKKSAVLVLIVTFGVYVIGYAVRFRGLSFFPDEQVYKEINHIVAPFTTSIFPYVVGMAFRKWKIFTLLSGVTSKLKTWQTNVILCVIVICMIVVHGIVQSVFVAIFTGVGTIVCFNLWKKSSFCHKLFSFLGEHSTNVWLTHMFFIEVLFVNLAYCAKYPLFCFLLMWIFTIPLSIVINKIMKFLNTKTFLNKLNA